MVIDGEEKEESLFRIVKDTLEKNPNANKNSVIAFNDNSSSIVGAKIRALVPSYNSDESAVAGPLLSCTAPSFHSSWRSDIGMAA